MTPMILQRNPALTISKTEFFPVPKPRASVGLAVKGSTKYIHDSPMDCWNLFSCNPA